MATITTTRCATRLLDEHGALLAEVADDRVFGAGIGEVATLDRWREVEVELGAAGDEDLLTKITKVFRKADAHPAPLQRKLDRLFAGRGAKTPRRTVNRAVAAYLQDQSRAILLGRHRPARPAGARGGAQDPGRDPAAAQHPAQLRSGADV